MVGCTLEPLNVPSDIHFLYGIMKADDQYLYSTKLCFHTEQDFAHWLLDRLNYDFHDFYIVKDSHTLKSLGYVHNYDFSLVDGHCKIVVYIIPEYRETGVGGIAAITFMKKIFSIYPLRKLYSTIYDYNKESLQSNLAAGFREEGVIREYRYYDGVYHSIHYLSMTKQLFENTIGKLVK